MRLPRTARLVGMSALGGAVLISSLTALVALNSGGALSVGSVDILPIAAGYDRRARAELPADEAPPPAVQRDAAARSRSAIAQFPYDTGAWLRLAYLDATEHGQLTPSGLSALQRSYDLVAADPDFGVWRIAFALEHSQALPQPLRASVQEEVTTLWTVHWDRSKLLNLRTQLRNPTGRLSLMLWINRLQANGAK